MDKSTNSSDRIKLLSLAILFQNLHLQINRLGIAGIKPPPTIKQRESELTGNRVCFLILVHKSAHSYFYAFLHSTKVSFEMEKPLLPFSPSIKKIAVKKIDRWNLQPEMSNLRSNNLLAAARKDANIT